MQKVRYFQCRGYIHIDIRRFFQEQLAFFARLEAMLGDVTGETVVPGLRLDFNCGLRLQVPQGDYHVRISDYDSGKVFLDEDASDVLLTSVEKYYIHWQVEVWQAGELVLAHVFTLEPGTKIHFINVSGAIGDTVVFLPYIAAMQQRYGIRATCFMHNHLHGLVKRVYPDLPLQEHIDDDTYATFYFGFGIDAPNYLPIDGRQVPMERVGQLICGLDRPAHPIRWPAGPRPVRLAEPYVCIGVQASGVNKCWQYPGGWEIVVDELKKMGYRVLCIDKDRTQGSGPYKVEMPEGVEDFTGARPLTERADMLAHAEFFIGLGSGLSHLAHMAGCPVVLICGFSWPWYEFATPYRVWNPLACGNCFNALDEEFLKSFCPRHAGTDKELECSKLITPRMVMQRVEQLREDIAKN